MLPKADHIVFGVRKLGIEAGVTPFLLGDDRFAASPPDPLEVVIDGGDVDLKNRKLGRFGPFRWNFEVNDFVHTLLLCRDAGAVAPVY